MVTQTELLKLVMENEIVLQNLLIHLNLCGLIRTRNKLEPTLENSELIISHTIVESKDIEEWIDEWRELFTNILGPYSLSMGIGNRQATIQRMSMFLEQVSDDVDRIFKATRLYLEDCKKHNRLSKLPQYFILPQNNVQIKRRDIREGDLFEWFNRSEKLIEDIATYEA